MADRNETKEFKKPKKDKGERRKFRRTREVWSELKKVTWPTFGTVAKSLGVVLIIMAIFVVVLLAFDLILTYGVFNPLVGDSGSIIRPLRGFFPQIKLFFSRSL